MRELCFHGLTIRFHSGIRLEISVFRYSTDKSTFVSATGRDLACRRRSAPHVEHSLPAPSRTGVVFSQLRAASGVSCAARRLVWPFSLNESIHNAVPRASLSFLVATDNEKRNSPTRSAQRGATRSQRRGRG